MTYVPLTYEYTPIRYPLAFATPFHLYPGCVSVITPVGEVGVGTAGGAVTTVKVIHPLYALAPAGFFDLILNL
jgi:hypothetical protein